MRVQLSPKSFGGRDGINKSILCVLKNSWKNAVLARGDNNESLLMTEKVYLFCQIASVGLSNWIQKCRSHNHAATRCPQAGLNDIRTVFFTHQTLCLSQASFQETLCPIIFRW